MEGHSCLSPPDDACSVSLDGVLRVRACVQFTQKEMLGQGGCAAVYRAVMNDTHKEVRHLCMSAACGQSNLMQRSAA